MDNKSSHKKTIGIIGGLGPKATVRLFDHIVDFTDAQKDQDHIRIIIDNNPHIPDRTAAILCGAESPEPKMTESARLLKNAGADFIIIPCNTSHYFVSIIAEKAGIEILSMVDETVKVLVEKKYSKVGILATTGTIKTGIYSNKLKKNGIEPIIPDDREQEVVMDFIYNCVKAGNRNFDIRSLDRIISSLCERGTEIIILGCTELSVGFTEMNIVGNFIDPMKVIARSAILFAGYSVRDIS